MSRRPWPSRPERRAGAGDRDPRFVAPEVQQGADWSPQADVYALAATLWTGFSGQSLPTAKARQQGAGLPDLSPALQGSRLEQALTLALHPDLAVRAVSASAVLEQLGAVPQAAPARPTSADAQPAAAPAGASPSAAAPGSATPTAPPDRAGRPQWITPVLIGLTLAIAGGLALRGWMPAAADAPAVTATVPDPLQVQPPQPAGSVVPPAPAPAPGPEPAPEPTPEPAPPPERPVLRTDVVVRPEVNVRTEPGGSGTVVTTVKQGEQLEVLGEQGEWSEVRVAQGGAEGWVKTELTLPLRSRAETQEVIADLQAGASVELGRGVYWLEQPLELTNYFGAIRGRGARESVLMSRAARDTVTLVGGDLRLDQVGIAHIGATPAHALHVSGAQVQLSQARLSGAVRDRALEEYGYGLWLNGGSSATIDRSSFEANAYGLYLEDTAQAYITASDFSSNREGGIYWGDQSGGELSQSSVGRNGAHGIHVSGTAQPNIAGNEIFSNQGRGITVYGDAAPRISGNLLSKNGLQGAGVQDRATPEIQGNRIRNNVQSGLAYFDDAGGVAAQNEVTENRKVGISVTESAAPTLSENQILRNGESGLVYSDGAGGEAALNLIKGHANPGIAAWGTARPTLRDNTVLGGQQSGIVFADRASGLIEGNLIQNQALYGVIVTDEAAPEVTGNTLSGNLKGGLLFKRQATVNAYGNVCENNGGQGLGLELDPTAPPPSVDEASCS
ncbi:right-handed parallel beta-helix repeat-containing protein [Deinococcus radiophilus]|uniref:right-handed parallel beta-helix repeat-containing protein n=1 Tax=Deinococcus radiophilus TaxID=32062 RepID=UPI00361ADC7D